MFNPFCMFCFAPDGVPDGAPAADVENEQEQHDDQQFETTEQTEGAAAKAAQTAAPAGKEQPVPKDEPKKDDKADDLAARVVTANVRGVTWNLRRNNMSVEKDKRLCYNVHKESRGATRRRSDVQIAVMERCF